MELKKFITDTLVQLSEAVRNAQSELADSQTQVAPYISNYFESATNNPDFIGEDNNGHLIQNVSFDVAVTVERGTETEGKISIASGILGLGSKGKTIKEDDSVSRIQFVVPVSLGASFQKKE